MLTNNVHAICIRNMYVWYVHPSCTYEMDTVRVHVQCLCFMYILYVRILSVIIGSLYVHLIRTL